MSSTDFGKNAIVKFSTIIPTLASEAALAIDDAVRNRESDFRPVHLLGQMLGERIKGVNKAPKLQALVVPGAEPIVYSAFQAYGEKNIGTILELEKQLLDMAAKLKNLDENKPSSELKKVRDFCSHLAMSASTCGVSILDPSHHRSRPGIPTTP